MHVGMIQKNPFIFPLSSLSPAPRWQKHAARRCVHLNQTWGPMISALLAHSRGTLNCQILTAMERPLIPAPVSVNLRQRTTRNRLPQNLSSPPLPKELICTPGPSSPSPSSSLMWFIGPYTCDYRVLLSLLSTFLDSLLIRCHTKTSVPNGTLTNVNHAHPQ